MRFFKNRLALIIKSISAFLVFVGLIYLVIFIFRSDYFKVSNLVCQRNGLPCTDKEKVLFFQVLGKNIFTLDSKKIAEDIKAENFLIKEVEIEKKLLNKVVVRLEIYQPFAYLSPDEEKWFILSESGYLMEEKQEAKENLPKIIIKNLAADLKVGEKLDQKEILSALEIIGLTKDNSIQLQKIMLDREKVITLALNEDILASFSAQKNIGLQVDSLLFILRQSKIEGSLPRFIDLRFDKPVVRF